MHNSYSIASIDRREVALASYLPIGGGAEGGGGGTSGIMFFVRLAVFALNLRTLRTLSYLLVVSG